MFRSWKLGRLFGIDIHVHWTFLFVPLFVLVHSLQLGALASLPYMLTLVAALFGWYATRYPMQDHYRAA